MLKIQGPSQKQLAGEDASGTLGIAYFLLRDADRSIGYYNIRR
jgi:hypothetical protein